MDEAARWLHELPAGRVAVAFHGDVDGLAAAVIALRALERAGRTPLPVPAGKGEHAHSPALRGRLRSLAPPRSSSSTWARAGPILEGRRRSSSTTTCPRARRTAPCS